MAAYTISDQLTDNGTVTWDSNDAPLTDVIGGWFMLDAMLDDYGSTAAEAIEDLESSIVCSEYIGALTTALGIRIELA